jgi:hypothetical protein
MCTNRRGEKYLIAKDDLSPICFEDVQEQSTNQRTIQLPASVVLSMGKVGKVSFRRSSFLSHLL